VNVGSAFLESHDRALTLNPRFTNRFWHPSSATTFSCLECIYSSPSGVESSLVHSHDYLMVFYVFWC
jgi:hypothetical protein